MQLFALFKSDARAVEHIVRNNRRIGRILLRIERQVEWGLRLMWDPGALETQAAAPAASDIRAGPTHRVGRRLSRWQAQPARPVASPVAARAG